mmetsp:Transcript_14217/g.41712  ORF Transcript_14217/g.41712 Transcript_14217/m.41712 type:complete len:243 (+) Transcript_14217:357-1085(+)
MIGFSSSSILHSQGLQANSLIRNIYAVLLLRPQALHNGFDGVGYGKINTVLLHIKSRPIFPLQPCPEHIWEGEFHSIPDIKIQNISFSSKLVNNQNDILVILLILCCREGGREWVWRTPSEANSEKGHLRHCRMHRFGEVNDSANILNAKCYQSVRKSSNQPCVQTQSKSQKPRAASFPFIQTSTLPPFRDPNNPELPTRACWDTTDKEPSGGTPCPFRGWPANCPSASPGPTSGTFRPESH